MLPGRKQHRKARQTLLQEKAGHDIWRCRHSEQTQRFNEGNGSKGRNSKRHSSRHLTLLKSIWWTQLLSFVNFISFHLSLVVVARFWTIFHAFHRPICESCLRNTTRKNLSTHDNVTCPSTVDHCKIVITSLIFIHLLKRIRKLTRSLRSVLVPFPIDYSTRE